MNQQELEELCIMSVEKNDIDKLKQYLSSGFSVNSILTSRNKKWDTNCFSILAVASFSGSKSVVEYLIKRNVLINQVDVIKKRTALHWAIASGHYEISNILIENGACVNALDRDSVSPLILAANNGDFSLVKMLIKHGANVNQTDRMNSTALHYACMRFHSQIAKELICSGCNSNTNLPFSFCSPAKYLICDKKYGIAKMLIESGCDLTTELSWILDPLFAEKNDVDFEFMDWLRKYVKNPPSLINLCRQVIRFHMGCQKLTEKVSNLKIPKNLEEYLLMKN